MNLQSLPTSEELSRLDVVIEKEEISHTIEHLIELIIDSYNKTLIKDVIIAASQVVTESGPIAAKDILLKGTNLLVNLEKHERSKNIVELNDDILEGYFNREKNKGQITGIPTGFHIFDNHTMGLQPQWLVTITARNGSYKTWILVNWALNAWRRGNNLAIFSCEMSVKELAERIHSIGANLPPTKVRDGLLDVIELKRFEDYLKLTKEAPYGKLIVNDNPMNMPDIDNMIAEMNETTPIDIVFIDAAYRMQGAGNTDVSKQTSIARAAKDLAKKYNIPVVCTNQLNREFAKLNANKDKTTSGGHYVYGTDAWNQDSDIVMTLHQPDPMIPYNYTNMILEKFRHGTQGINYVLEINLLLPKIEQVDAQSANDRIVGNAPKSTQKGQTIFEMAQNIFVENENAVSNDILETFKKHQEKLQHEKENPEKNEE